MEFTSLDSDDRYHYRIDYVCTHEDSEPVSCVPTFQQSTVAIIISHLLLEAKKFLHKIKRI